MAGPQPAFVCDLCSKAIGHKGNVLKHILSHREASEAICDLCNTRIKDKELIHKHMAIVHKASLDSWTCDMCHKTFDAKSTLSSHLKLVHQSSSKLLRCKQSSVHRPHSFVCDCCDKTFHDRKVFGIHFRTQHQKTQSVECPKCNRKLPNHEAFLVHKIVAHRDVKYVCDRCEHVAKSKRALATHSLAHQHHQIQQLYQCSQCNVKFLTISNLDNHLDTVHKAKQFHCDNCAAQFRGKHCLYLHVNAVHLKLRLYKCSECDASYTQSNSVDQHIGRMHRVKVMQCDACAKKFSDRNDLARHICIAHMPMQRIKCDQCAAALKSLKYLKMHKRKIHGG